MGSYVARQPIFNKSLKVFGYELLFRVNLDSTSFQGEIDGDAATSETIMNTFHDIGIDRVTNGNRAFINFTENLLLDEVATILPSRILVVEILENILPTEKILNACRTLKKRGYLIALDDFVMTPEYMPFLSVANIVKIDFMNTPKDIIKPFVKSIKSRPLIFLAEKLETYDDFEMAKNMGFSLFQGYFFSKPVIVTTNTPLTPMKLHRMQLIALSFDPNVSFSKMANVIKQDIALSYRLFRVVNSAFFGLRYTVKNIRQALSILGMDEIKKWITLISMSELKDDKPNELITVSLVRARFLELIAPLVGMKKSSDDLFMVGLMSLIDALMDLPMDEIFKRTMISPNISQPLLTGEGRFADLLSIITAYESSDWDKSQYIAEIYNLSLDKVFDIYLQAIDWANQL